MAARVIRLLHVEDDEIQRKLMHAKLKTVGEFDFQVTYAGSEDEALSMFAKGYDFVILDYLLSQGNGLSCLKKIRQKDSAIPIIAVSGVASTQTAAELLEAGADDYFTKDNLEPEVLAKSVHSALARADAWKARAPDVDTEHMKPITNLFQEICSSFIKASGGTLLPKLDELESTARAANLSFDQALRVFEASCDRIAGPSGDVSVVKRTLRPLMLEIVLRLFEQAPHQG